MNTEFFEALALLEKEKGIPEGYLLEKIKNAIVIAVRRDYEAEENVLVDIDPATAKFSVAIRMQVVEEVENPAEQLTLDQAQNYSKRAKLGGTVDIKLETKQFGRIAAQTAKHIIRQGIREAERGMMLEEFQSRQHEIVTGVISRIDERKGLVSVEIGKFETILPRSEQVQGETLHEGDHIKVYVVDVLGGEKGPKIMISRTHPGLVKRLFEMEVPEIFDGTVEIKAVAREAGSRTKLAVTSDNKDVDAVGACIGPKGARVSKIVDELGGEKIDVIKYSEVPEEFIAAALSPANIISVQITDEEQRACKVTVPDEQLSLAIGNKGQNARLAAKLTGYKIDIRPESGFFGEKPEE